AQHKIVKELAAFRPDVVHIATELGVGWSGLRAAQELGLPIVMSYHTNYNRYLNFYNLHSLNKAIWGYLKWFHGFAEMNLCPSEHTLNELAERGFSGLGVWSRGVDAECFHPGRRSEAVRAALGGAGKTIYLYVGRIAAEKGLDTLAESIRSLNAAHQNETLFVFTGEGPYLSEMARMEIPNAVFTGAKYGEELAEIYASSDVFVFPSGTETFGNVMLEAMACGLPGICVNSGGVTDFTTHGQNALVCQYRSTAALAEAMEQMLNPALRSHIRLGALQTAGQRSWDAIFERLVAQYSAAVRKPLLHAGGFPAKESQDKRQGERGIKMRIAIAGTGYVGLVTGVCLAHMGHEVTCVETDAEKLATLQSGRPTIYETGVEELMKSEAARLTYTGNFRQAYQNAEVIFICVGTPERADGYANLKQVYQVAEQIVEAAQASCVVVMKSTVPMGTKGKLEKLFAMKANRGIQIEVASNPEFLSQGTAVRDFMQAQRIVLGVKSPRGEEALRQVYAGFDQPVVVTDPCTAEMIKYASNNF
ncbi:MAG: nucleotide sugar dehydrogenase, partial [Oscillospiraceae bacterium]